MRWGLGFAALGAALASAGALAAPPLATIIVTPRAVTGKPFQVQIRNLAPSKARFIRFTCMATIKGRHKALTAHSTFQSRRILCRWTVPRLTAGKTLLVYADVTYEMAKTKKTTTVTLGTISKRIG